MSNKPHTKINELDTLIRNTLRLGMSSRDTFLKIEFIWGFELFNTRPYHNYETWSGGYRVTDQHHNIKVESEDLDDALKLWAGLVEAQREGKELPAWQKVSPTTVKEAV